MIAVIFEVRPKPGRKEEYLGLAADLRPLLEKIDGFISVERFESLAEPGKILRSPFSGTRRRSMPGATRQFIAASSTRDARMSSRIIACASPA